jgi:hypothetical protein
MLFAFEKILLFIPNAVDGESDRKEMTMINEKKDLGIFVSLIRLIMCAAVKNFAIDLFFTTFFPGWSLPYMLTRLAI